MRIVLLGPPGVGKGTQAERICRLFRIPAVSTGEILRNAVKAGTELGEEANAYISRGDLVPDETMIGLIRVRLHEDDCAGGFILDGFPRTVAQAHALDALLAETGLKLDHVLSLAADENTIVERISGRQVCTNCGAVYHKRASQPAEEGICDACGRPLAVRADDAPEAVKHRLDVYRESTAPLIEYYKARGQLVEVDAAQDRDSVTRDVEAALRS